MFDQISQLINAPKFEDANEQRVANLLNVTSLVLLVASLLVTPTLILALRQNISFTPTILLALLMPSIIVTLATLIIQGLLRRRHLRTAGILLALLLFMAVTLANYISERGLGNSAFGAYFLVIILASLLLGGRLGAIFFTALSTLAAIVFYLLEIRGVIQISQPESVQLFDVLLYVTVFVVAGLLLRSAVQNLTDALIRIQASEQALAASNRELQSLNANLEQRVAARTHALETSTLVSRRLSTILDQDELIRSVVQQMQDAFDYYHVHIYLLDKTTNTLLLAAGTGEAGAEMLAKGHSLRLGQGLVGQAAATNTVITVADVTQEPTWLPNPLLPETKAETAVPIAIGDDVLGVLDVQQNVVSRLETNEIELLHSIAAQVGLALRNARLYKQVQQRAAREAQINEINQKILSTNDVASALQVAVRELGRVTGAPRTAVRLTAGSGEQESQSV